MSDERDVSGGGSGWEEALRAGFARAPGGGSSVIARLQRLAGVHSSVMLHDAPDEDAAPLVRVGAALGDEGVDDDSRYQVMGEIARGGVGVIYRGRDRDLGRDVALKVLRQRHAKTDTILARFIEEAQIAGQLQHPGIVPVYGLGLQADGRPYFAMKLVKGRTLAALLQDRSDPKKGQRRFLQIFEQVCQAVAFAHVRDVIHRDLKPANVMAGSFGEVQVLDWGFGKVLGREEPAPTETQDHTIIATVRSGSTGSESVAGSVMGTPGYMPPEQARGDVDALDARADVFALGAILCEILTGEPPYTGTPNERLVKAAQARLQPALERLDVCGADGLLVDLSKRCLAPVLDERPHDAQAVAQAVSAHLTAVEERAHAAELDAVEQQAALEEQRRAASWEVRARRKTRLAGSAILLAALLAAFAFLRHDARTRERAEAARPRVDAAIEESVRLEAAGAYGEAVAAAAKARDLARTGEAGDDYVQRAQARHEEVLAVHVEAQARAAQAAADAAMLERLDAIRFAAALPMGRDDFGGLDTDRELAAGLSRLRHRRRRARRRGGGPAHSRVRHSERAPRCPVSPAGDEGGTAQPGRREVATPLRIAELVEDDPRRIDLPSGLRDDRPRRDVRAGRGIRPRLPRRRPTPRRP